MGTRRRNIVISPPLPWWHAHKRTDRCGYDWWLGKETSTGTPSRRRRAHTSYSSLIWPQIADTVELEIAAWSPSASARAASTSRTDRPRTNEAITSDSTAFVF